MSALSHRGFATLDWRVGLKVNSDISSQTDTEEDSGVYVREEVSMGELCFLQVWKMDFFSDYLPLVHLWPQSPCFLGRWAKASSLLSVPAGPIQPSTQWGHYSHLLIICLIYKSSIITSLFRNLLWLPIALKTESKCFRQGPWNCYSTSPRSGSADHPLGPSPHQSCLCKAPIERAAAGPPRFQLAGPGWT